MKHFAFPGNILRRRWPRRILTCLFIVCETKFTIGESRRISHENDTQAQQVAPYPRPGRFSTETPLERERRLQIQREQRRRRRQQETAEQKEHRLAQRRQRRQQETEEQEIGIRGIMIVLHCRKPRFLSLPVSPPIYRSKSVSALYYGSKNNNFRANCTGPYLFFAFVFFLNPDAKIMLNLLFNTLLTISPHNTQKRRKRKERTTYGPLTLRRYSRF